MENESNSAITIVLTVIGLLSLLSLAIDGVRNVIGIAVEKVVQFAFRNRPPVIGAESLIGKIGEVTEDIQSRSDGSEISGRVKVNSEYWPAKAISVVSETIKAGKTVKVARVDGITLLVEPINDSDN
jgi:membrane-bound ClpP family serine protease